MKICWFGIYNPDFGRNKIYINALKKAGHTIVECRDDSRGFIKFFRLWQKHRLVKDVYDALVVGYPGHLVVPLAKLISTKLVTADLLGSIYDAEINSHHPSFWKKIKARAVDFLAIKFADRILLESEAQKKYFEKRFGRSYKYRVLSTGVDEIFINTNKKGKKFLVLFRGKLTPESGIIHILQAAKILREQPDIGFRIIGFGYFLEKVEQFIKEQNLFNVELISRYLPDGELVEKMSECNLMLGQFESNPRVSRTIPHKVFEAFAMEIPYLTGSGAAIKEIVKDNINAFIVPLADSTALAKKVEYLFLHQELLGRIARQARIMFDEKFAADPIARDLIRAML